MGYRLAELLVLLALAASLSQGMLPDDVQALLGADDDGVIMLQEEEELVVRAAVRLLGKSSGSGSGGGGSGSGSGSGYVEPHPPGDPHGHPAVDYVKHLHHYAHRGGWHHEPQLQKAKEDAARATAYAKLKLKQSKKASLGCPCIGEKYYNNIWNRGPNGEMPVSKGSGSGSGKQSCMMKHPDDPEMCMSDAELTALTKRMIKKYGKLGPNSTWTKQKEAELNQAAREVLIAMKDEHFALIDAKDDIKRMLVEMPDFFHNGKCGCPNWWTEKDAAGLRLKKELAARADAQATKKAARVLYADGQVPPPKVSSSSGSH